MDLKTLIDQNSASGLYLLGTSKPPDEIQGIAQSYGFAFFHLRGKDVRTKEELFPTMKKLLGVPMELGENFDAFYDILIGFRWNPDAKNNIILYDDIEYFAENNNRDFDTALHALERAAIVTDHNRKLYIFLKGSTDALPGSYQSLDMVRI